jgi:neutral amino acid transport system permease protein
LNESLRFLQAVVDGVSTGAIVALVAVGLSLVFRLSRFVNVAHVDMVTIGAYGTLLGATTLALSFSVSVVLGVVATMVVGWLCYRLVFRRLRAERSITLIIASVGVAFFLRYLVTFIWGSNQLAFDLPLMRAWRIGEIRLNPYDAGIIAVTVLSFVLLLAVLRFTAFGRALRAVADNPDLARVAGLNGEKVINRMWLIGSALAGLGGILLGAKTVITPYMGWYLLLPAFAAMIFGGVGSVGGTLVAAVAIGIIGELAATYWAPTYRLVAIFGVIVLVLIVRPQGLFGAKVVAR